MLTRKCQNKLKPKVMVYGGRQFDPEGGGGGGGGWQLLSGQIIYIQLKLSQKILFSGISRPEYLFLPATKS